ncbi:MAG TPA: biotin/lipoyl-binding protein [Acidothermaceae bacterium]
MRVTKWTAANVVLAAVALTGGGLAYATVGTPSAASSKSVTRTATIASGTVMTTVSSTGNVTAPNNVNVNFGTSGTLTEIDVKVGQIVKQGQVLARVDSTAAKASYDSANAQLASAQANLTELQQGVTPLVKQSLQISNAQASQQVVSAKTALTNAEQNLGFDKTNLAAAITKAQQQLATDQASAAQDATTLQLAVTQAQTQSSNQLTLDEQQLSADTTQESTDQSKKATDCAVTPVTPSSTAACDADTQAVTKDGLAVTKDQTTVSNDENASGVTNAENSLAAGELRDQQTIQNDQTAISNAQTAQAQGLAKDQQSITNAQQGVTNAQLSLESTENQNAQKTAAPLASAVQTDQAAIEQAQAQVDTAKTTLDATALVAPAAGTIGAINETVGQTVSAGTTSSASTTGSTTGSSSSSSSSAFITLTNLTDLQVVADVDEADASKVVVGAPATVTLNALPTQEFAATVIAVANSSTVVSNVVEYQVTFELNNTNPAVKPGMTASVTVTTAKADGVLNVTSSAVHTAGGTSYVLVRQPDGTQKQVDVVVGLKGDTTTEITGAVKAGDVVVLPATTIATGTGTTGTTTRTGTTGLGGGGAAIFGGGGGFGGRPGG